MFSIRYRLIFLVLWVLLSFTGAADAAPVAGNKGGCGHGNRNMVYGVACTVTDAGTGFVSGTCEYGLWFSRVATARTFRPEQAVSVNGCEGLGRVTRRAWWPDSAGVGRFRTVTIR